MRGFLALMPVPLIEALALPDSSERATPQPTQYMYNTPLRCRYT